MSLVHVAINAETLCGAAAGEWVGLGEREAATCPTCAREAARAAESLERMMAPPQVGIDVTLTAEDVAALRQRAVGEVVGLIDHAQRVGLIAPEPIENATVCPIGGPRSLAEALAAELANLQRAAAELRSSIAELRADIAAMRKQVAALRAGRAGI